MTLPDAAPDSPPDLDRLTRSLAAVGELVDRVEPGQWTAPTPCHEWDVRRLVEHLTGMNRVFVAVLQDQPVPRPGAGPVDADPAVAFGDSAAALITAFARPGVLDRNYPGPLGDATGRERLEIRLYDLLAHGWDLARAIDLQAALPTDAAEHALTYVRTQLNDRARPGRFEPAQPVTADAPALDRLAAFLGRSVDRSA